MTRTAHKLHYAWINVIVCCVVLFACGTISQTYGIFLKAMAADLEVNMASISGTVMILNAVMVLFGPVASRLVNRYGMRRLMPASMIGICLSLFYISCSTRIYEIYIGYAVLGCCMYYGLFYLCPFIVNRWFAARSRQVISAIISFMAVGGMVGNLALSRIIQIASWRSAYKLDAMMMLVIAIAAWMLLRDDPASIGKLPYGVGESAPIETACIKDGRLTARSAFRRPEFYLVVIYVGAMQFSVNMQSQIPTFAVSIGLSVAAGAVAASINSFGGIPAKVILGITNSRWGIIRSVLLYNSIGIIGLLCGLLLHSNIGLYSFSLLFGFAIGSTTVQLPTLSNEMFGRSVEYDAIHANIVLISGLMAMPGSLIAGGIYDATGSYSLELILLIILFVVAAICAILAVRLFCRASQ